MTRARSYRAPGLNAPGQRSPETVSGIAPMALASHMTQDDPMKIIGYAVAALVVTIVVKLTLGWVFGIVRLVVGLAVLGAVVGVVVSVANAIT